MSKQPEVVKQSDLLNQFVLDRRSLQELGQVEVMWMYPKVHRVLGFICKSGLLGRKKTAFNLDQLDTIGANGVLVNSQPVETDVEKVRQLESLVGCEVWTDAGNKAGRVVDYLFDLKTGVIEHYLFMSSGVTGSIYKLPPNYILSLGNRRVLVSEAAVRSFAVYREGLQERFYKAADFLREEKTQVTQEFRSIFQQAKERAQILNGQLKEKAEILAEQAKETGQVFVEKVRERTHEVAEIWDDWENEPLDSSRVTRRDRSASSEPDPLEDWDDEDLSEPVEKAVEVQQDAGITRRSAADAEPFDGWEDDDFVEPTIDVSAKPIVDQKLIASSNQPPEDLDDDDPWI